MWLGPHSHLAAWQHRLLQPDGRLPCQTNLRYLPQLRPIHTGVAGIAETKGQKTLKSGPTISVTSVGSTEEWDNRICLL